MPAADTRYRFTFGPWNLSTGADPFGPPVRPDLSLAQKLRFYKQLGYDGVQLHDDDVIDAAADRPTMEKAVRDLKKILSDEGLFVEFVAPRLWEAPQTMDGAFTSNRVQDRQYAIDRSKRSMDIGRALGTNLQVLWLAREGTYIREAKDPMAVHDRLLEALDAMLEYDPQVKLLGEMKPNEPMDLAYWPTPGHFLAMINKTKAPERVGVLIESAHAILAGLDPSDEMAYALWHRKLWSVHLNDQNGLKFDQDKSFASVDLRRAFNTVWVLDRGGYGSNGECIGMDVKPMRTTTVEDQAKHLANSRELFLRILAVVRKVDNEMVEELRLRRNYEDLEMYILSLLLGR